MTEFIPKVQGKASAVPCIFNSQLLQSVKPHTSYFRVRVNALWVCVCVCDLLVDIWIESNPKQRLLLPNKLYTSTHRIVRTIHGDQNSHILVGAMSAIICGTSSPDGQHTYNTNTIDWCIYIYEMHRNANYNRDRIFIGGKLMIMMRESRRRHVLYCNNVQHTEQPRGKMRI